MKQSIFLRGYKCFSVEEDTKIEDFDFFNVFVGKNNSGKSSALDVMCSVMDYGSDRTKIPNQLELEFELDEVFCQEFHYGGRFILEYCQSNHLDRRYRVSLESSGRYVSTRDNDRKYNGLPNRTSIDQHLPHYSYPCRKISAERNIYREPESAVLELKPSGEGATNLIRAFLYQHDLQESVIEEELLNALNRIMCPDACFESIRAQYSTPRKGTDEKLLWEIYLQEKGGGRLPLSQVGSGLKTIILVLLNLLVVPKLRNKEDFCFAFEELENNLHPALQRRLFEYIHEYSMQHKCYVFLTTHSHAVINTIFDKQHVSVYHVSKESQKSHIKKINNYADRIALLDDLNIKASDLLQANGLIWVEGPSDRVYIKKWLEVFGGAEVQEGRDFQFVYYGGKLLSHYTAEYTDEEEKELIDLLLVNRNSAIVMDSDKTEKRVEINKTKKRIDNAFREHHLFSWITQGKEIENYIAVGAIQKALDPAPAKQCSQYKKFPEYIRSYYPNFENKKVVFANKVKEHISNDNVLDLESNIKNLYDVIKSWNE